MVDFQSRDSRQTFGGDDDEDTEGKSNATEDVDEEDAEAVEGDARAVEEEEDGPAEQGAGAAAAGQDLGVAVVTVDGETTVEDDRAGSTALDVLGADDYEVATREVIAADYDNVQQTLGGLAVRDDVDVVVTFGGDGVGPDDVAVDAARALFDKDLPAFGELFRSLARESIGTGVLHTRTCAGVMDGIPVFCLPASADAARLGLQEIVLPELDRLVDDLRA